MDFAMPSRKISGVSETGSIRLRKARSDLKHNLS